MGVTAAAEHPRGDMETSACQGNVDGNAAHYLKSNTYVHNPAMRMDISVQSIVDDVITEVPALFVKPEQTVGLTGSDDDEEVPIVDMAAADAAERIVRACEEWGVFLAINHQISQDLVERAERLSAQYFSMPKDDIVPEKRVFQPQDGTRDWTDCLLHFPVPFQEDHELRTKWPAAYRETLSEFVEATQKVVRELLATLSTGLGLPPKRLMEAVGDDLHVAVKVNHYPPCPEPEKVLGLTSHTDHGMATILVQNEVPGLQVVRNGQWSTVKPVKGSLVIIVANMVEILSNGTYKSVEHRAIVNNSITRTSMAIFHNLAPEVFIEPLPELVDEDHPPLYKRVQFGPSHSDYERLGLRGGAVLDSFRLNSDPEVVH